MKGLNDLLSHLRERIAQDDLEYVLERLREFFQHSPRLHDILLQSARFTDLLRQINHGAIDHEKAQVGKNQIRSGIIHLIDEIERQKEKPELKTELKQAGKIASRDIQVFHRSKNILTNPKFESGSSVRIGDDIHTESNFSKRLRLILFIVVPVLAIGAAYFWYAATIMNQPLHLKVFIENKTPNPQLEEASGTIRLTYGAKTETKTEVRNEAFFEDIPPRYKEEPLRITYQAPGFIPIDTTFEWREAITLAVQRNDDLALIRGIVSDADGQPLENVQVSISCCSASTNEAGIFNLAVPPIHQRKSQRLNFYKKGFLAKDINSPIIPGEPLRIILEKSVSND